MSTATAQRQSHASSVVLFSADQMHTCVHPKMYAKKDTTTGADVLVVEGIPVFRSGTFRDSMGYQATYEELHIDQMVSHYDLLRNRSIFADVPVRDGHPGFLFSGMPGNGKVIGYHIALRAEKRTSSADGKEYTYLLADYEILDPEAQASVKSGLWRNRSAEVGSYVTNDEAEFWPVYQGVAYVDIPAVEGLNSFSKENGNVRFMMEEESMTAQTVTPPALPTAPQTPVAPAVTDTAAHAAPAAPESAAPVAHTFSIGGKSTQDFGAVQQHINQLETENAGYALAAKEADAIAREDFCKELVSTNRMLATQLDDAVAYAQTLDTKQFTAWKALQSGAPAQPLFGQYGAPQATTPPVTGAVDTAADVAATLQATVKQHSRSGMAPDKIKETSSYKQLIALDPTFKL